MKPDLSVNIGRLKLKNPVMAASGTFGYGEEFCDFMDLRQLGAVVTKTITCKSRQGNSMPRTCETPAGMLNSIGLENPGIDQFIQEKLPELEKNGVPLIVSISSEDDPKEFPVMARRLDKISKVAAIELNISCPNVNRARGSGLRGQKIKLKDRLISQDPWATYNLVKAVRRITGKTLITKLSPNVTDIAQIALAAEKAGSDAVSLVNTFYGLSIDVGARRPMLGNITGGLSGPAIRPIALGMVWEVYQKIKIPIIGMGGIMDTKSALEFFIAGATAVSVGTANFINPKVTVEIILGLKKYLNENKMLSIKELIGSLKCQN